MRTFDSIVVGSGVIGSSTALQLASNGRTLVLEQFRFLHENGSSHGGSRIFRHAYEDTAHVRLAVAADAYWVELEKSTGERLLQRTGSIDIGTRGGTELVPIREALAAAGSRFELLPGSEAAARFPAFALDCDAEALFQPAAGIIPATRAIATMLRAAAGRGAVLRDSEEVTRIVPGGDSFEVVTTKGVYTAGQVVVAAGPWLGRICTDLELPLRVQQQQVVYLKVGADASRYMPDSMPVFIDRRATPTGEFYGFPLYDMPHAIKVGDHAGASTIDLDERTFRIDEEWLQRTANSARILLPGLTGEIDSAITCLYTKTPDELFILDRHPEYPGLVLAGGGSGHAFKFGPVLGEAAAALATGGVPVHDITPFSLSRPALKAVGS